MEEKLVLYFLKQSYSLSKLYTKCLGPQTLHYAQIHQEIWVGIGLMTFIVYKSSNAKKRSQAWKDSSPAHEPL